MPDIESSLMSQRLEIVDLVPKNTARILDVGCSEGDFGSSVKKRFHCEVFGIEIDREKASKASSKLDKVIIGDVEQIDPKLSSNSFDCIVFADVLEHLKEPAEVLKRYLNYLRPDGCLVISIPNIRHLTVISELLLRGEWRYRQSGIMDKGHLRFFTIKSFLRLLEESNIYPVRIKRVFSLKGSRIFNFFTLGIFKEFLTAQYLLLAKNKRYG